MMAGLGVAVLIIYCVLVPMKLFRTLKGNVFEYSIAVHLRKQTNSKGYNARLWDQSRH